MRFEQGLVIGTEQHLDAQIGEPFRQQALRRADEKDRLLEVSVPPNETRLFPGVLGVMTGIGLVRNEVTRVTCSTPAGQC